MRALILISLLFISCGEWPLALQNKPDKDGIEYKVQIIELNKSSFLSTDIQHIAICETNFLYENLTTFTVYLSINQQPFRQAPFNGERFDYVVWFHKSTLFLRLRPIREFVTVHDLPEIIVVKIVYAENEH